MKKTKILPIAELGQPVIRQKAQPVKNIKDPKIQKLIDGLIATCDASNGVGIAAPQVYQPLRLFIVWSRPNKRYPKAPKTKAVAMINPRILWKSKEKKLDWEGCLSIPGIRGLVPRHTSLHIEYTDRKGKIVRKKLVNAFVARIFQHELDHLDGKVFLDRANIKTVITDKEYKAIMAKK